MKPTMCDLCLPCAEKVKAEYELVKQRMGIDNKITCACCGRRRFGATFLVQPKKPGKQEK